MILLYVCLLHVDGSEEKGGDEYVFTRQHTTHGYSMKRQSV